MRKKKKKWITFIVIAIIAIVIAAIVFIFMKKKKDIMSKKGDISVQSTLVERGDVTNSIVGTGTLTLDDSKKIVIPSDITIKEVKVSSGDAVKKGDVLATVDKNSVLEVMNTIQSTINDIDEQITDCKNGDDTETIEASIKGTVKKIYGKKGASVIDCIANKGAVMVIESSDTGEEIEITAGSGTISYINVSEGQSVSVGKTLYKIKNDENSEKYNELISQRKELSSLMKKLAKILKSGTITAGTKGIIGSVNVEGEQDSVGQADQTEQSTYKGYIMTESAQVSSMVYIMDNSTKALNTTLVEESVPDEKPSPEPEVSPSPELVETETSEQETDTTQEVEPGEMPEEIQPGESQEPSISPDNPQQTLNPEEPVSSETPDDSQLVNEPQTDETRQGSGNMSGGSGGGGGSSSGEGSAATTTTSPEETSLAGITQIAAFTFSPEDNMNVSVNIDELDINSVALNQEVEISVDALDGEIFPGYVTKINQIAETSSNGVSKYTVQISVPMKEKMKVGMNATATIVVEKKENVLTIPVNALQERRGSSFVYTTKESDGTLSGEVEVVTGLSDGTTVEIVEGIEEGATVYYQKTGNTSQDFNFGSDGFNGFPGQGGGQMPGDGQMPGGDQRPRDRGNSPDGGF